MAFQDIIPITSIFLIILGFLIILVGLIWLANTISNEEVDINFTNTDDIIGEMNAMFTYFTDQIDKKDKKATLEEDKNEEAYSLQNKYYIEVLECKKQGKTPDQIAKELNIGKGEVNLILGIDQMR